jgi:Domain of unknown function (DUF4282)/GYF domain 2
MSQWRVAIGQKQYGPYSLEKLRQIHEEGRVPQEAQIWHPDQQKWVIADQVAELTGHPNDIVVEEAAPVIADVSRSSKLSVDRPKDTIGDFLAFRRMITPIIIQIVFWIGAVLSSMAGIFLMIASIQTKNVGGIFMGFFAMLLGPITVRIYCELLIVFFRMNETLTDIHNELKRSS